MGERSGIRHRIDGHHAAGRLQAEDAAEAPRDANRAAAIRPDRQRRQAGRHRGGRAAAGAARRFGRIPGIPADPGERRVGGALPPEFRRRRLAHHDPAGSLQSLDDGGVLGRNVVREDARPEPRPDPSGNHEVFDRERHAVQRAEPVSAQDGGLGRSRLRPGGIRRHGAEGVESRIEVGDSIEDGFDRLDRGHLLVPDQVGQIGGGHEGEFVGAHAVLLAERVAWARDG